MGGVVGLCDICGGIARHTCRLCGKRVCGDHYDKGLGLCTSCKGGRRIKGTAKGRTA